MKGDEFMKLLEEEKKKLFNLKKDNPNNPLFSMLNDSDVDISQEDFIDTCQTLMNGDLTDNISQLFMGDALNNLKIENENKPEGGLLEEEDNKKEKKENDTQVLDG